MRVREQLRSLSRWQREVLWWKCKGFTYRQMASDKNDPYSQYKVPFAKDRITQYMAMVYEKIGLHDKNIHHQDRKRILDNDYCSEVLKLWPDRDSLEEDLPPIERGFILVETEDGEEELVEIEEEPEPDPRILALVLLDEEEKGNGEEETEEVNNEEPIIILDPTNGRKPPLLPPTPQRRRRWPIFALFAVIFLLTVAVIYLLIRDSLREPDEIVTVITNTPGLATLTPVHTVDVAQVETNTAATVIARFASDKPAEQLDSEDTPDLNAIGTTIARGIIDIITSEAATEAALVPPTPTLTPLPTNTPTETPTPTPTIVALQVRELVSNGEVTLTLDRVGLLENVYPSQNTIYPIVFWYTIRNDSFETRLLDFDHSNFTVKDNTGRTHPCEIAEIPPWGDSKVKEAFEPDEEISFQLACTQDIDNRVNQFIVETENISTLVPSTWAYEVPR